VLELIEAKKNEEAERKTGERRCLRTPPPNLASVNTSHRIDLKTENPVPKGRPCAQPCYPTPGKESFFCCDVGVTDRSLKPPTASLVSTTKPVHILKLVPCSQCSAKISHQR
jgi:hypothetical protein